MKNKEKFKSTRKGRFCEKHMRDEGKEKGSNESSTCCNQRFNIFARRNYEYV